MPLLAGGFTIQASVPIDDRFFVTGSGNLFDIQTVYNGLTVYVTGSNEYHLIVDQDQTTTNVGWRQLSTHYVTSSTATINSTTTLYDITTGSQTNAEDVNYHSAHSNYQIYDGNGTRAGSLITSFNGSSLDYTDFSNAGTGDQANYIELQVVLISDGIRIQAVNTDGAKTPEVKVSTYLL
jgi:hypothetical protein